MAPTPFPLTKNATSSQSICPSIVAAIQIRILRPILDQVLLPQAYNVLFECLFASYIDGATVKDIRHADNVVVVVMSCRFRPLYLTQTLCSLN